MQVQAVQALARVVERERAAERVQRDLRGTDEHKRGSAQRSQLVDTQDGADERACSKEDLGNVASEVEVHPERFVYLISGIEVFAKVVQAWLEEAGPPSAIVIGPPKK